LSIRERDFETLQQEIVNCRRCPRLVEWRELVARRKVRRFKDQTYWGRPVPAFGDPGAALVLVGLAPAAHGGNRTGRMFTGDRSGDWLYDALYTFGFADRPISIDRNDGLELVDCLVTASVRCAPPDNKPLPGEIETCGAYLARELRLAKRARVVVALGQIAFRAFLKTWCDIGGRLPQPRPEFHHGSEWPLPDRAVTLLASYHPSQQNTQTGRLTRPMFHAVFSRAHEILGSSDARRLQRSAPNRDRT
jgi:uracil-DNA glycosylase family 4